MTHPTAPALPARFGISEKERNRMAHSLRGRLLWWLLLPPVTVDSSSKR